MSSPRHKQAAAAAAAAAPLRIREVWSHNLHSEFALIRHVAAHSRFVALDTEFPGVVLQPSLLPAAPDLRYQTLRVNVDNLKLIQLGLTFTDEAGRLPFVLNGGGSDDDDSDSGSSSDGSTGGGAAGEFCAWQFNFRDFNLHDDLYAPDSIKLLQQSGIDFEQNERWGVDSAEFASLFAASGLMMNPNLHYISFHGAYDFAYLLKTVTRQKLPTLEKDFLNLLKLYFGKVYDLKYMMRFCHNLYGGLNKLAESLEVRRFGGCHQAGSDSLVTSLAFQKLKDNYFNRSTEKYSGVLYGMGISSSQCYYYNVKA